MKKYVKRRILSILLAVVMGITSVGFLKNTVEVYADDNRTAADSKTFYTEDYMKTEYISGSREFINGEKVLRTNEKANALVNIYRNSGSLDVLEIVPYKMASYFNLFLPTEEQKDLIAQYADAIFNNSTLKSKTELWSADGNTVSLKVTDYSKLPHLFAITDEYSDVPLTVSITRSQSVNAEALLNYAEQIVQYAVAAVKPDDRTNADAVLAFVNEALNGTNVTAEWAEGLTLNTLVLTISDSVNVAEGSVKTRNTAISFDSVTRDNINDVMNYAKAYMRYVAVTARPTDNSAFDTRGNDLKNNISGYLSHNIDSLNVSGTAPVKDDAAGVIRYSYTIKMNINSLGEHTVNDSYEIDTKGGNVSDYTVTMDNYYLEYLFKGIFERLGYDNPRITPIYEYFKQPGKINVKTVVASDLSSADFDFGDGVDLIYVADAVPDRDKRIVYRNALLMGYLDPAKASDVEAVADMIINPTDDKLKQMFPHTGVYDASGNEIDIVTLSSGANYYYDNTYNSAGMCNELSWSQVRDVMDYVFSGKNPCYDAYSMETGDFMHHRIPVMFQASKFCESGKVTDSNMAKLYLLLCKSTDQKDTVALDSDVKTYYHDTDYFGYRYFNGTAVKSNGVVTGTHDGNTQIKFDYEANTVSEADLMGENTFCRMYQSDNSYGQIFDNGLSAYPDIQDKFNQAKAAGNVYILKYSKDWYSTVLKNDDWNNNNYATFNGVVGMNNREGHSSFFYTPGGSLIIDNRYAQAKYRLEGNETNTFFTLNDYLLGIDETDFIVPPVVKFTKATQENTVDPSQPFIYTAERASDKKAVLVRDPEYINPENPGAKGFVVNYTDVIYNLEDNPAGADTIRVDFEASVSTKVDDTSWFAAGKILDNKWNLYTIIDNGEPQEVTTADWAIDDKKWEYVNGEDVIVEVKGHYNIVRGSEAYNALVARKLKLRFQINAEVKLSDIPYNIRAYSDLVFVYRKQHDLD